MGSIKKFILFITYDDHNKPLAGYSLLMLVAFCPAAHIQDNKDAYIVYSLLDNMGWKMVYLF